MRMWLGVEPWEMCRKHLLGEHCEVHMAAGWIERGKRLGRLASFLELRAMRERHDALVREMERRGYRHGSPLAEPDSSGYPPMGVDRGESRRELARRCPNCSLEEARDEASL